MDNKDILINKLDRLHTTAMEYDRIKNNLKLDNIDVVEYCKNKILDRDCCIYKNQAYVQNAVFFLKASFTRQ